MSTFGGARWSGGSLTTRLFKEVLVCLFRFQKERCPVHVRQLPLHQRITPSAALPSSSSSGIGLQATLRKTLANNGLVAAEPRTPIHGRLEIPPHRLSRSLIQVLAHFSFDTILPQIHRDVLGALMTLRPGPR